MGGCCSSTGAALSAQTSAVLQRYSLGPQHMRKAYALFVKIQAKANRGKTPLQLKLQGARSVIHPHEVRAVLAIPHSLLSDHLMDLIDVETENELTFPEFLELVTVVALLSKDQLLSCQRTAHRHRTNLSAQRRC